MRRVLWAVVASALVFPAMRVSAEEQGSLLTLNEGASAQKAALAELTTLSFQARETERPRESAYGPDPGDWEITLTGTGSMDSGTRAGAGGVSFSVGYFFTKELEVAFRQNLDFLGTQSGSDFNGASRVAVDWNFDLGRFRPFVGANLGVIYGEDIDAAFLVAPEAGVKFYIVPKTFLFLMAEYQWPTKESFQHSSRWVFSVGMGLNF